MEAAMRTVESLQAEIAAIQDALAREQLDTLPQMLHDHDQHLREFCADADVENCREQLRVLQAAQHRAIAQMRQYQQHIRTLMQSQRRSNQAARAYAQGGQ